MHSARGEGRRLAALNWLLEMPPEYRIQEEEETETNELPE